MEIKRRFYNFETDNANLKQELGNFCKESGIYYEVSSCFDCWHFEIKCSEQEKEIVQNWIDTYFEEREIA